METIQGPDGATVESLIEGDGAEAIVFVHASASGIAQWRTYQQALSDRYVTAAVHLHGYGATTSWDRPYRQRLADQAGLVGAVIQAIGRPTHIVGHSFGGAVALETARQCRDDVVSVAVYEPTLFWALQTAAPECWEEISALVRAVQTGVARGDLDGAASGFVDYWARAKQWERMNDRKRAAAAAAMVSVAHEADALMSPPPDPDAWLADVPAPTLVMQAQDSPAPVRKVARLLAEHGQRRLHVLESGGHMMPVTNPDGVLAVLQPFLDGRSSPSRPLIAATASR
jgi:pimeloyl-ACP methyl ester carboxylesterase